MGISEHCSVQQTSPSTFEVVTNVPHEEPFCMCVCGHHVTEETGKGYKHKELGNYKNTFCCHRGYICKMLEESAMEKDAHQVCFFFKMYEK